MSLEIIQSSTGTSVFCSPMRLGSSEVCDAFRFQFGYRITASATSAASSAHGRGVMKKQIKNMFKYKINIMESNKNKKIHKVMASGKVQIFVAYSSTFIER